MGKTRNNHSSYCTGRSVKRADAAPEEPIQVVKKGIEVMKLPKVPNQTDYLKLFVQLAIQWIKRKER